MRARIVVAGLMCVLAIGIASALSGCAGGQIIQKFVSGSGKLVTNTLDFAGFNGVEVTNAFEAEISRADTFSVTVTTDDNLFQYVEVRKSGSTLVVGLKPGIAFIHSTQRIEINMPELRAVTVSGAAHASVSGFSTANSVEMGASGASTLELDNLKFGNADMVVSGASRVTGSIEIAGGSMVISGASTVELTGSGQTVRLDVSGAGSARLADFPVVNADTTVSGASNAAVTLSGRLDADVSGASRLTYGGGGTLGRVNVTGASALTKR